MLDWIHDLIDASGPLGVALLMFIENVFPPIPSELVMPLAGAVAQGYVELAVAIGAGTIGSLAGAVLWYAAGRWLGERRLRDWTGRHGR